jgi:hypothetical protein
MCRKASYHLNTYLVSGDENLRFGSTRIELNLAALGFYGKIKKIVAMFR